MKKLLASLSLVAAGALALAAPPEPSPAERLKQEALASGRAWERLAHLTDRIGHRLSGSEGAAKAVAWAQATLAADGLAVRLEPVKVPVWTRGEGHGEIVAPAPHRLALLALGGSDPTPAGGIEAEVLAVRDLPALAAVPDERVRGKIVLFTDAMARPASSKEASSEYGRVGPIRSGGASAAARKGAVAALVRSLGTLSARLPHTGAMRYDPDVPRIPAAAVAAEDAELMDRLQAGGTPARVRLVLGCRSAGEADSFNVVADLQGREKPEEVVLVGGHLDSWDVGTGAVDDGAGVVAAMETLRLMRSLPVRPRRTVRAVLFMNEENGLRGGRGYEEAHRAEMGRHVAAIESDSGAGRPLGFAGRVGPGGIERLRAVLPLLADLGVEQAEASDSGGADISPLRLHGVPVISLRQDATRYFDWHHTEADTLDKVDPEHLRRNVAAMAVLAWELADAADPLPRAEPSPETRSARGPSAPAAGASGW